MSLFKCPVCNLQLTKSNKTYKCQNNHSYDLSKKGYVNLMLANQGHSLNEGDSKEMLEARRRFLNDGFYSILRENLLSIIENLIGENDINFLDVACGEGYYTNFLHEKLQNKRSANSYGVDISKSAINFASSERNIKKLSNISYCVGNLDYLPFLQTSFDVLLNCFAPINEHEFARVLKKGSYYIRVLPGKYHLVELKEFLYKEIHLNEPKEDALVGFVLQDSHTINSKIFLNNLQIQDLFTMTPYYYKTSIEAKERLKKLEKLHTTISFVIKIYRKK